MPQSSPLNITPPASVVSPTALALHSYCKAPDDEESQAMELEDVQFEEDMVYSESKSSFTTHSCTQTKSRPYVRSKGEITSNGKLMAI